MRFMTRGKKPKGRAAKATPARRRGEAAQKRARRIDHDRLMRGLKFGALGAAALMLIGGGVASWQMNLPGQIADWTESKVMNTTASLGLAVKEVYVIGRQETDRNDLLAALNIQVGDPILGFSPESVKQRVEQLGWVKSAEIRRTLPGIVVVKIVERQAVAIWQNDDQFVLIDSDGVTIGAKDVLRHGHLKQVVGPDAPEHTMELLKMLAQEPELEDRVLVAMRIGARRWSLRLSGGIDVNLPEENADKAWHKLAVYQREHEILSRAITEIDLRNIDRITVELTKPALQEVSGRNMGEQT
ncbi:MAG: FtsQ-type POTRA domain-containing protein [Alphaproteobacteria bacterium]|nr:FtsQ-type POTRA domain-containing protein [Alphaproteobacteria bacterium]